MFSYKFELAPGDMVRVRQGEEKLVISSDFYALVSVDIQDDLECPFIGEAKMSSL